MEGRLIEHRYNSGPSSIGQIDFHSGTDDFLKNTRDLKMGREAVVALNVRHRVVC
tara:strand:- start:8 stop:172 length:165 start_codon:yes stop_codon:yes gene_type:complete